MAAPRRDELRHVVVGDLGDELILAEKVQHEAEICPRVGGACEVLRVLGPIAPGDVVELERRARVLGLRDQRPRALALDRLYFLGFALVRLLCTSEKLTTSDLESILPERRARVATDGHGRSFRVWLAMKASRSASVNMRRIRFVPLPMLT